MNGPIRAAQGRVSSHEGIRRQTRTGGIRPYTSTVAGCGTRRSQCQQSSMTTFTGAILGAPIMATGLALSAESPQTHRVPVNRVTPPARPTGASRSASTMPVDAQNKLVSYYCSTCHDDEAKTGGLSLQNFDGARIGEHAAVAG